MMSIKTLAKVKCDEFTYVNFRFFFQSRLSGSGYSILTREQPKLFELSESTVLASTGCWCDVLSFARLASAR